MGFALRPARVPTLSAIVMTSIVIAGAVTMIAPYVWLVVNSLKTVDDFSRHPYAMWPNPIDFGAYARAFTLGRIGVYLGNSLLYAVVATIVRYVVRTALYRSVDQIEETGTAPTWRQGFRLGWSNRALRMLARWKNQSTFA